MPKPDLEFDGEFLIPRVNTVAYRRLYILEGWLRRICLAAWMGCFGTEWTLHLEPRLRVRLEGMVRRNRRRLHLEAETSDDLIWQATHHELRTMITDAAVAATVGELTGTEPGPIGDAMDGVREIRNILAHNRALSIQTHRILDRLISELTGVVDTFRQRRSPTISMRSSPSA